MKKKYIVLPIIAVLISSLFFLYPNIKKLLQKESDSEWYQTEFSDDNEGGYVEDLEYDGTYNQVYISDTTLIENNLTLNALSQLIPTLQNYLTNNGYPDATELTILEDSVNGDKTMLYFSCAIKEYPNSQVNIEYVLRDAQYIITMN